MGIQLEIGAKLLNKYKVEATIGQGGGGAVYRATDTLLRRRVAIKTLLWSETTLDKRHGTGTFNEFLDRFRREAQVSSFFTGNPNIITVYSLEQDSDSNYFLVMEYLENGSLSNLLKREGALPVSKALALTLDICHALSDIHNHSADIVHRDLKPSNILLRPNGSAVVADFGIAQLGSESHRTQLSDQRHPGSPPYRSPEQNNTFEYLTPASDLYSLGLILYEMVTGRMYAKFRQLPASRENPQVPAWLDRLIERLLQTDPQDRYRQAEEVVAAIRAGQTGYTALSHPAAEEKTLPTFSFELALAESGLEKLDRQREEEEARQRRRADADRQWQQHEAEEARRRAEATAEQERQAALAEATRQHEAQLAWQIADLTGQQSQAAAGQDWNRAIELGEEIIALRPNDPASLLGLAAVYKARGISYYALGDYERAIGDHTSAIELELSQAVFYYERGKCYHALGDFDRAVAEAARAIELDANQADFYYERGRAYHGLQDYHKAIADYGRAIQRDATKAYYFYQRAVSYEWRSVGFYNRSDADFALTDFGAAVRLDPFNHRYIYSRGLGYRKKGDHRQAARDFEAAAQLLPTNPEYWFQLGISLNSLEAYTPAIEVFGRAIRLDGLQADYYFWRGQMYRTLKDRKSARRDLEQAAALGHATARAELAKL